jgi:hypothetical protein
MNRLRFVVALACAVALAACGGVVSPSQNQTEHYTGTVDPGGVGPLHVFSTTKSGEYTVTVNSMTPSLNVYLSVILGYNTTGGCAPVAENDFVQVGPEALAGPIQPGSYCVVVQDLGRLSQSITYTMTVAHP